MLFLQAALSDTNSLTLMVLSFLTGNYNSISAGKQNSVDGYFNSISGGEGNVVHSRYSSISGYVPRNTLTPTEARGNDFLRELTN